MHKIVPETTSPGLWNGKHESNWAFFEFVHALGSVKSSFSAEDWKVTMRRGFR